MTHFAHRNGNMRAETFQTGFEHQGAEIKPPIPAWRRMEWLPRVQLNTCHRFRGNDSARWLDRKLVESSFRHISQWVAIFATAFSKQSQGSFLFMPRMLFLSCKHHFFWGALGSPNYRKGHQPVAHCVNWYQDHLSSVRNPPSFHSIYLILVQNGIPSS